MKSDTQTLIGALRTLSRNIETDDGVFNAVLDEAAQRLRSLSLQLPVANRKWQDLHDNDGAIIDGYSFVCNDKHGHIDSYGNVTWSGWNTAETLPDSGIAVLAVVNDGISKPFVIRAMYAARHTLEPSHDYEDDCDYDEEEETYYCKEGWYENNCYEYTHYGVDGEVTHWMPIPSPQSR
jgi:hypothetical protein